MEAKDEKDSEYLRGVNYRNKHHRGICLILTHPFKTLSDYLQAIGRVKRGMDEGEIWVLQTKMYPH